MSTTEKGTHADADAHTHGQRKEASRFDQSQGV